MQKRIEYVDFIKGFAIMLVIFGHIYGLTNNPSNFITNIIGSLHNPLFYLASGMLFSLTNKEKCDLGSFIIKKVVGLIIPFCIWIMLYSVIIGTISKYIDNYAFSLYDIVNKLWFLPVLCFAQVVMHMVKKINLPMILFGGVLFSLLVVASFYSSLIAKVITFTCIFGIGTIMKDYIHKKIFMWSNLVVFCGVIYLYYMEWIVVQDGYTPGIKLLIMLIGMITGGTSLYCIIVKLWDRLKGYNGVALITYIGKKSLYIYILHYFIIYYLEITSSYSLIKYTVAGICALAIPLFISNCIKNSVIDLLLFRPNGLCRKKEKND